MSTMTYIINNRQSTALITKQGMSEQLILLEKEKLQDIQEVILRMITNLKSLATCITISQDWKGFPLDLLTPFTALLFPGPDADTTGEHIEDALSRKMCSICGRNGPPSTN